MFFLRISGRPGSAHGRCAQAGDGEAFAFRGCGQAFVETHKPEGRGPALGRRDTRRELESVSGAKLVRAQEPQSSFPKRLGRLYLMPRRGKAIEPPPCRRCRAWPKLVFTLETRDC
ncbi:MAG TPA: hypothetical protein VHX14_23270 [Thermoanaerobaculia bacterium]|jgi:hypothetical protein|nr:hypothetical protein [Thermoanaerobaculia bacterium]